ncbi:non-ribosomal peptide synthetase [Mycobacterium alsense]|uniref:Phenyloxazoline synthase MbtB n=1 Tax=Mycobacterium alsense TaxID=324058 RepID=A0AA41XNF6_9MYCO|nr:non-ribosomal peptide synthetase [Mycobacterium alsense]OQZ90142.1 non-ribosomal peptide synthetase [Mycobacterium alsense]
MVFTVSGTPISATRGGQFEHRPDGSTDDRLVHDVIAEWVGRRPDSVALRMVDTAGTDVWTYRRLWDRVGWIRDGSFADLPFGSRVLMAQAGDADYVAGFVAALAAGLIPVPLFLPSADAPERFLRRAQHILRDCAPAAVYTSADFADVLGRDPLLSGLAIRTPDSTPAASPRPPVDATTTNKRVAFLQYTSGSTGEPKGIVNTHESMLHQRAIGLALWNRPDDVNTVSWLPLYHDLGIFWGVLLALATGGTATVIPPLEFVRNPRIWLQTVTEVRGNWIAGPDFGYRRCIDAFDEETIEPLDLSCLHLATNGAEPVRPSTLRDFAAKFEPAGFRADAMAPQYGLAEAGLAVTGMSTPRLWVQSSFDAEQLNRGRAVAVSERPDESTRARTLVSCGDSTFGWDVRIVDPERRTVVPDGEVGEVWVGGVGLPQGYWGRPEQTAETFGATTADGMGPYLRTGDAAFRSDGEMYICGRYRDLIIVGGGNYFPNDIESTVEEARCGVESGGACAVQPEAFTSGEEWWLIVETDYPASDLGDISRILRRRILQVHQTAPERIVWVRRRVLPRTTSGKIRRRKALAMLNAGDFDVVREVSARPAPSGIASAPTELAEHVAGLLGVQAHELAGDADLTEWGLTSMLTAQVVEWSAARSRRLDFADLYAEPTLDDWQRLFDGAPPAPALNPSGTGSDSFALTALQRAYWIGRGAEQPLGGVGCQTYFELAGVVIDPRRLATALDALAHRHPMLRSRFPDADRCRIAPYNIHVPVRLHDFAEATDAVRVRHLDEVRNRLRTHRFGLETGDTWRVELTRLPDGCILHFALDLIIADLTSIGILLRDLAALYRGERLPAVSAEFGDLVCVTPPQPADDVERLPEGPQLPRAEEREIAFRRHQHTLDASVIRAIDASCRAHGVTRAAVFLAAYASVLRRWSSTEDFLINVTTFGRPPGVSDVIGDFTKTQLHRTGVEEPAGFADQARGAQRGLRAALAAPEATDLLAAQLHGGTGHSGIAPVVFTYAADTSVLAPRDAETLGTVGEVASMTPQVIIDNQVGAVGDDLIVSWDYRAGCFPPGVVADMFHAYVTLLESLGTHDWSGPAVIDLPEHSRRIRRQRNATTAPRPVGLLYDAFREQTQADPTRIALRWATDEFDGGPYRDPISAACSQLSYGALDEHARRVAGVLADRHAPGSVIGVQLPKGPAQVVAVLGVLMAGCSYLPVGVDQPEDRFARICALSGMSGAIRSSQVAHGETTVRPMVHDIESMLGCAPVNPVPAHPGDIAYVIYTSGSTGDPKGVLVSHSAALNTIIDVNRRNGIRGTDSLLAVSALDFDLSVYDIFGPLSCGANVIAIAERSRRDAFRWNQLIADFGVTLWDSVPALMDMLLIAAGEGAAPLSSLRTVFLSGDWIPLDLPRRLRRAAPEARLVAMGGATEAAIWSNEFVLDSDVDHDWVSVPYGYPLANQMFRVVDDRGRDCPDYVAGELWIGGAGVAQGYQNAPALTVERFLTDRAGNRWYRTGDLGCYWPDGTLQFLGRVDSQVKINGHRVECGEIEHVLREHPLIAGAAVVPVQGNSALGAAVVSRSSTTGFTDSMPAQLRHYLADRLPQYMVPRWFVPLAELPLTANGKVDRRRVASEVDAYSRTAAGREPAVGLSPVERLVAGVWSEVLATPITNRDDNFFQHGGDSLRATQVAVQLTRRGVLGADVGQLLGRQTLAEFSSVCVLGGLAQDPAVPAVEPVSCATGFPLTRLQQAYVLGSAGLNGSLCAPTYFAIVLAANAPGDAVALDRFAAVVGRCIDEFAVLRCTLDADTTQRVHAAGAPVSVNVVDAEGPDALMRHMADASFDPRAVPVIQCFAPSGSSRYVGLLVNYLSLDARSLATVIATIIADYQQAPRPRQVDPSADVFARYAAESQRRDESVDHGVGAPPALPLTGRRIDSATRAGFARTSFTLGPHEFAGLRDRASRLRVTPTALIFEAFTDALHSIGAGERFAVVVPTSHRPDYAPADREVLGNFTRLALCDVDYVAAQPGSRQAVIAAQEQLWRAVGSASDATGHLAASRAAGSAGHPVVFTSTLGLAPQGEAVLSNVLTLTQTPGVWLDCQVEDHLEGGAAAARVSWDAATGIIADESLAEAFSRFEHAVRRHAGQVSEDTGPVVRSESQPADSGWAGAVIAAAAGLCEGEQVHPEYEVLVRRWQQVGGTATAGGDTARAARRLADIVIGAASPQTLVGDPQLAPEAMLLAEARVQWALDDLCERVFAHARLAGRRLRVLEVGSRTGLITQRVTGMVGAVVDEYLCYEPNPVLAEIAAGRRVATATRPVASPEHIAAVRVDIVICCGSLHQLVDAGTVLDALTVADDGWLWVAESCEITAATLASAAVLNPVLLSADSEYPRAPDRWWRFLAEHRWRPVQMTQDGPGLTIIARPPLGSTPPRAVSRPDVAPTAALPQRRPVIDEAVLAAIAGAWQRHLNIPGPDLPSATDDFFLLGGDSLVATRVYADLRAAGFERLALVDLFNYPVLGDLAAHAGAPVTPRRTEDQAATGSESHHETEFPLTVVQHAYLAGREGGFMLSGVAAHCYFEFAPNDFDRARFEKAARQLIEHHPGLRTTVATTTNGAAPSRLRATVHPAPIEPVVREYDNMRARMRDQVIDLTARPGIDFGVQVSEDGRSVVGISMDNVMLDGTSMMIALAQLDHLYRGGSIDELPPPKASFAQYVNSHPELWPGADELTLPHLAASRAYWRARLPALPPAPELVPMQVILAIDTPVFDRVEATVVQTDWERITQKCRTERVTAAAFLLANYTRVLARWAGTADFCVNVTLFDRDPGVPGIEDVIGDFTSLLLLECHADAGVSIWEQARRLQHQLITDLPHRTADAVWLQRELLRHHGQPAHAVFPVVFTSGLGLIDTAGRSTFEFGDLVFGLSQTPQTVLDFQMWEKAGSLSLSWDFVTQAIPRDTARRNLDMMVAAMVASVNPPEDAAQPDNPGTGDEHVERVLRSCAAALGVSRVEPRDNFFLLGGDSATATRVVEQLRRDVSATATLRLLFENPVIGEFAEKLRTVAESTAGWASEDGFEEGVL